MSCWHSGGAAHEYRHDSLNGVALWKIDTFVIRGNERRPPTTMWGNIRGPSKYAGFAGFGDAIIGPMNE